MSTTAPLSPAKQQEAKATFKLGSELYNKQQYSEAIAEFNKVLDIDKNLFFVHYYKGRALLDLGKFQEAITSLNKAIELTSTKENADYYFYRGVAYSNLDDYKNALENFEKAVTLNPSQHTYHDRKGYCLYKQEKYQEAVDSFNNAINKNTTEQDPDYYFRRGMALYAMSRYETALESYEDAIKIRHDGNYYRNKGIVLKCLERYSEAIESFNKAIEKNQDDADSYFNKGNTFCLDNKFEEALKCYDKAISLAKDQENALYFCQRGKVYNQLREEEKSIEDFNKAQRLMDFGKPGENLTKANERFIKETLKMVLLLKERIKEAKEALKGLDPESDKYKQVSENLKKLQEKGIASVNDAFSGNHEDQDQIRKLTEEFAKVTSELKSMKATVADMQDNMAKMKEELDAKMDNYSKILVKELKDSHLPTADQEKLKGYFDAFVRTFNSVYVTSQMIESGNFKLNAGDTVTTVLSTLASFSPFFGDTLSSVVRSVGEFLKTKEMKESARKTMRLANGPVELSDQVCKAALEIIRNPVKRAEILALVEKKILDVEGNIIQKLKKIASNISEKIDVTLYSALNKIPAEKLGTSNANGVIEKLLKNEEKDELSSRIIKYMDLNAKPVELETKHADIDNGQEPETATTPDPVEFKTSRSACCNMF